MCNIKDVCCNLVSVKWSIASWMSSKLEPVIWLRVLVTLAYMKGRTDVRTYVRTDVHDVMAIKSNFLTSMGYHIFLSMVLRARAPSARAELRYNMTLYITNYLCFFSLTPFITSILKITGDPCNLILKLFDTGIHASVTGQ